MTYEEWIELVDSLLLKYREGAITKQELYMVAIAKSAEINLDAE